MAVIPFPGSYNPKWDIAYLYDQVNKLRYDLDSLILSLEEKKKEKKKDDVRS